ncbi:MAG: alpha/beta hydrolase [Chromatiales bacterium]|jgi:alpha/beta superfamily hydrolase|nr:MAG: alpha/beta hydrolase [Chromatiales bacterium]
MSSGPPPREALTLDGPAGCLEALLDTPSGPLAAAVAVVCHPHPQHQGTMLNKVVHTLSRALNDLSIPVVRFNFRGVGASEGAYADGFGETEDVLVVADWATARFPGADLWLAGFSFGAAVAIRAALSTTCAQLISVAPPVARMASLLDGKRPACPWLLIQGTADEIVAAIDVQDWARTLDPPPDLVLLPDVDHFFHGRLTLLRDTVVGRVSPPKPR